MIHITLGPERTLADPDADELGRTRVGFSETMSEQELYEANHGCYVLGTRADSEQYALFSFEGRVVQAIAIDRLIRSDRRPTRRIIEGHILQPGDPVYDEYVGKPSPVHGARNPVTYFDAPVGRRTCRCGCGGEVTLGYFLPGHDQRAIHDRIARVGTVVDFLDWFDAHYEPQGGEAGEAIRIF